MRCRTETVFVLCLEAIMLISWKQKGASGDFATVSNWDPAAVPGPADDAIIGVRGNYTVTSSVDETVNSLAISEKHATLLIEGASRFSDTLGGVNHGTIVVDGSSSLSIGTNTTNTTLANVGTIDLNDNSLLVIGQFGAPASVTVSVTGGGHIHLSGGEIIGGFEGVTMVTDNKISGTGEIDFSAGGQEAHGHWINQGVVDASTPNGNLTIGHTVIENSGILEATNGGLLNFSVAPVQNAAQGVVEAKGENSEVIMGTTLGSGPDTNAGLIAAVDSGTLLIRDVFGLDNTHGTIKAGHGSTIGLEDGSIVGGLVTVMKGGILEAELQGGNTITGAVVTNAGTIGAEGANLTIVGDVTNTGTLDANNATLVINGAVSGGKATLEGTGEIEFGAASAAHVTFAASSNAVLKLDNSFSGTVSGLTTGDYIDLTNINFADNPTLSFVFKTHVLTVTDSVSHVTDTITFKGAIGSFSAQSDGNGGTLITDPPATVAVSHDSFVFAANPGENGSKASNAPMHHEPIDFWHHGGDVDHLVALMGQAHTEEAHLIAAPETIDGTHAVALTAHHFWV
jgi:hypothetical protein